MTRSVINFVHFNLSLRPIYMEAREAASYSIPLPHRSGHCVGH